MKTELQKFNETIGILVDAYFKGTLEHMDCAACAVGNIIASKLGCHIDYDPDQKTTMWFRGTTRLEPIWPRLFFTPRPQGKQRKWPKRYRGTIAKQVDASGYSWQELARIERAFESVSPEGITTDEWNFNGLMAVVDVLADIHAIELDAKESAKLLFTPPLAVEEQG